MGRNAFTPRSELSIVQVILIQAMRDLCYRQSVTCALSLSTAFFPLSVPFPIYSVLLSEDNPAKREKLQSRTSSLIAERGTN